MIFNTHAGLVGILHPPKCAGGSVKEVFLNHFGTDSLVFPTRKIRTLKLLKLMGIDHYHYTYKQFELLRLVLRYKVNPRDINWVVVVRDPFERMVSLYKWKYLTDVDNYNSSTLLKDEFSNFVFNRHFVRRRQNEQSLIPSFAEFTATLPKYCNKTELCTQSEFVRGVKRDKLWFVRQSDFDSDLQYIFSKLGLRYVNEDNVRRHVSGHGKTGQLENDFSELIRNRFIDDYKLLHEVEWLYRNYC